MNHLTRWVFPLALVACSANGTGPTEGEGTNVEEVATPLVPSPVERVPFCLPGERRVCTLGPPPVCHCEVETSRTAR